MAIGTPVALIGAQNRPSGGHNTTTGHAPVGSLIVVLLFAWTGVNGAATGVTDSAGNTYTLAVQDPATASIGYPCAIYYCNNSANDLPSGGWIASTNSGATNFSIAAYAIPGANGGLDVAMSAHNAGATTLSLVSGALASANEILIGLMATTSNFGTVTEPGGFTLLSGFPIGGQDAAYEIVSSNASVTYNPSWTNSVACAAVLASFKATASGGGATDDIAPRSGAGVAVTLL
jgi:hypothetical protein